MRTRVIDKSANQHSWYPNVRAFSSADTVPQGIITVTEGGVPIDFLNSDVGSDTTIVFFHGAIELSYRLPVLSGQGISDGLGANRIFISDPSLYLSDTLTLGWFAGNEKQNLQRLLVSIIEKLVKVHGSKRLVFFGGSGGGFAALWYSAQFPGSLAIPFNPQTNIARYLDSAIRAYTHDAYGVDEREENPLASLPGYVVTNLCETYAEPTGNTVAYIQNLNDVTHVEQHMEPFMAAKHHENVTMTLTGRWQDGHTPPPKETLRRVLESACHPDPWSTTLLSAGFHPA